MAKANRSRRTRKNREDPVVRLALRITTPEQARHALREVDVVNHTAADQRHSIRAKETKTVRKLTRVEMLVRTGDITHDQAAACTWYAMAYELGFQTIGCTANYCGAGGGGFGAGDLLARYKAQGEARDNYFYARSVIPPHLLGIFEGIILGNGRPPHMLPKADKLRFSLAAFRLHEQIGHMLAIAA